MESALIWTILSTIFAKTLDLHIVRFCFFSQKQEHSETSVNYLCALQTIAKDCNYGGMEEEMVILQFQTGLCHPQQKTFSCNMSAKSSLSVEPDTCLGTACELVSVTNHAGVVHAGGLSENFRQQYAKHGQEKVTEFTDGGHSFPSDSCAVGTGSQRSALAPNTDKLAN